MPQVPYQPLQTVAPSVPHEYSRATATPDAFGAQVGGTVQQLGNQLERGADRLFVAAADFQKRQDETDVDNIYANVFSPAFRDMYHKYYALQGKDAVDALPKYLEDMTALRNLTTENLPNERQKHLFNSVSRRRVEMELDGMGRYAEQQNRVYKEQTFISTIDNYKVQAADKYNSEVEFGTALGSIEMAVDKFAAETGKSAEWARDKVFEAKSSAIVTRIERMMVDDPLSAAAQYKMDEKSIDPRQRALLEHKLKSALQPIEITGKADEVMVRTLGPEPTSAIQRSLSGDAPYPAASNSSGSRIAASIYAQESGSGAANTSGVNAQGVTGPMQIKDTTWKQYQDIGVIPKDLKWSNPADNKRGGDLLVAYYEQKYGGDPAKVAAAYYGGEGAVNADGTINRHWKNPLRPNDPTVGQYVDQVLSRMGGDAGNTEAMRARDVAAQRDRALQAAREQYPDPKDAVKRQALETEVNSRFTRVVQTFQATQNQATSVLTKAFLNEGGVPPMTVSELTASPEAKRAWAVVPDDVKLGFYAKLEQNQKKAEGRPERINAALEQSAFARMLLPPDDPNAITRVEQLTPLAAEGLTATSHSRLVEKLTQLKTPEGKAFQRRMDIVVAGAYRKMRSGIEGQILAQTDPEKLADAELAFRLDLEKKMDDARAAGKPTDVFITPGKPEYVGDYNHIKSFLQSPKDTVAGQAAKVQAARQIVGAPALQPAARQTAVNPQTGETLILKDGKWQKP